MENLQPLFDLFVTVASHCSLDYVFVADTNLTLIECILTSLDYASDPYVITSCEAVHVFEVTPENGRDL